MCSTRRRLLGALERRAWQIIAAACLAWAWALVELASYLIHL